MLEYVVCFASLLVVASIFLWLARAVVRHADRTEDLVTSDCP